MPLKHVRQNVSRKNVIRSKEKAPSDDYECTVKMKNRVALSKITSKAFLIMFCHRFNVIETVILTMKRKINKLYNKNK
jgi:hypothetical protein